MSYINYEKHRENLLKLKETHDAKKGILQTWEVWRQGKFVDRYGNVFVYKPNKKIKEDLEYESALTRRVRNLYVRIEAMKPIGELEE